MKQGRLVVSVTQLDINQGQPHRTQSCPIARALKRATKAHRVSVRWSDIRIARQEYAIADHIDNYLNTFIERFDKGLHVKPFKFIVDTKMRMLTWA